MRKIYSLFLFIFIAALVLAFYPIDNSSNRDIDSPSYKIAKQSFFEAYLKYKNNLEKGIVTEKPVDPSGNFIIDENGNFNMARTESVSNGSYHPLLSPDAVAAYIFTQSTGTYTSINTTGTLVAGSTNCDDSGFGPFPIGFNFTYNGATQTQFGVNCNGSMQFGAVAPYLGYTPLMYYTLVIALGAYDMMLSTDGAIYYQTTGSAPNRVCTIEWYHQGFYYNTGDNELSYQVKLFETTNAVQILYQTGSHLITSNLEVGINGDVTTDFANRTSTTGWSNTTPGGANSATVTFSPTYYPASGLTFQWAPAAPPPVPTLLTPANHSVGVPLTGVLVSWTASAGATNYNLMIALDSLMTTVVYNDTTLTGVSYSFSGFGPLTNWWWRVKAKNAAGWSAFTIPWVFRTMGAPTVPVLNYPANNAVNVPIAFTTNWRKSIDQTSKPSPIHITNGNEGDAVSNYWYELYTDTTGVALVKDSTLTDTTRAISGLLNNTNYWWRVKAKNTVGWGAFSAYFKFTTVVAAPPVPTNVYPANNSTGIIPTTKVDWSTVAGATQYRLQISTDPAFATAQLDTIATVDSLFVPAGRLLNNTLYYWHVQAQNAGGNSAYSGNWQFTTSLVGIQSNGTGIPSVYKLYQAYPNPFNPSSTIKFDLPKTGYVKMEIFNMLGQVVGTLVNGNIEAGSYSVTWDAANYASGVYFYKISAANFTDIRKMVLIK